MRALHRPAVHPRGDLSGCLRGARTPGHRRGAARADHGDGRPQHPHREPAPPDRGARVAASGRGAGGELREIRHRTLRRGEPSPGHRAYHRPGAGLHAAGHDDRLRRQPYLDPRGAGRRGLRRGYVGGRDGLCEPVHPSDQAAHDAHHGRRGAAAGRRGQGRDPLHHLADHRFGRHGLFHRVRREHDPLALDGGTHDGLQHEHRVRGARGHDPLRGGGNFTATRTPPSTRSTASMPPTSAR